MRGATPRETAPSCGAAAARRSAKAGPLDGVYRFAVTLSDLRAAGADPSELLPENFCTMTVVIDRERFASIVARAFRLHAELLRRWPSLAERYRAALPDLVSPEAWRETFDRTESER